MGTPLEEKRKNRFVLLRELYDITDGLANSHSINIRQVGKEVGMDENLALDTFEYLKDEGLAQWMALGGYGTITHWGVKEVEDALDHKPTAHFPGNIVLLVNSPGANVSSGEGHSTSNTSVIFDQRGQHVNYQYNSAGNINIGSVQDRADLVSQLDLLKQEIAKAHEGSVISELTESRAKMPILEAIEEAKKPKPDKSSLLTYLGDTKDCLKGIAALGGIVEAVTKAYEWVEKTL